MNPKLWFVDVKKTTWYTGQNANWRIRLCSSIILGLFCRVFNTISLFFSYIPILMCNMWCWDVADLNVRRLQGYVHFTDLVEQWTRARMADVSKGDTSCTTCMWWSNFTSKDRPISGAVLNISSFFFVFSLVTDLRSVPICTQDSFLFKRNMNVKHRIKIWRWGDHAKFVFLKKG